MSYEHNGEGGGMWHRTCCFHQCVFLTSLEPHLTRVMLLEKLNYGSAIRSVFHPDVKFHLKGFFFLHTLGAFSRNVHYSAAHTRDVCSLTSHFSATLHCAAQWCNTVRNDEDRDRAVKEGGSF